MKYKEDLIKYANIHFNGLVNSYGQIFFSQKKWFVITLFVLSLLDLRLGIGGAVAVLLINIIANIFGFPEKKIKSGIYGFNAIFVGMCLVNNYYFNYPFIVLFALAVLMVFIISIWLETVFAKQTIPILTLPFVFTMFIIDLSIKSFANITPIPIFDRFTILLAEQMKMPWYNIVHSLDNINFMPLLTCFFKILASVFFTDSILVGLIIAGIMLLHSRIKFSVAFLGFSFAFIISNFFGADLQMMVHNMAGVNYVFWSMALGSFFIIPNIYSYLLIIGLTPALFLFYASIERLLFNTGLSSYTLSFSILTMLVLFFLKQRPSNRFFIFPLHQYYNPEKTVYKNVNYMQRFGQEVFYKIQLPFLSKWKVSQGYNGTITHLGNWSKALDFVITDENGISFSNSGNYKEDYYCYSKPILAPADGYIYMIINHIDDNEIGDVNTNNNWGNTIIINHLNGLYSQIGHLKKDSFLVKTGDYVSKGTILATCGNSGRSPEPHVHFQLQLSHEIGSYTHYYPFGYFFEENNEKPILRINDIPKENAIIYNVSISTLALSVYDMQPGKFLNINYNNQKTIWNIATDSFNNKYIQCENTNSIAYFVNDGTMFYFTDFEGEKSSALYLFYLSCFKIFLSSEKNILIADNIPLTKEHIIGTKWIQDFLAPFFIFTKINFTSILIEIDNIHYAKKQLFKSNISTKIFGVEISKTETYVSVEENKILVNSKNKELCIEWA